MRDESASPSASRTVGRTRSSISSARSRIRRRMTSTCWASFCPKYAWVGWTIVKSLRTIVATPRKCPGRCTPSRIEPSSRHLDPRLEPGRVHLVGGRREDEVYAGLARELEIVSLVVRVALEVGSLRELGRVDEERHHHRVALRPCCAQEREVALVQGAHRRHDRDRAVASSGELAPHCVDRPRRLHDRPSVPCANLTLGRSRPAMSAVASARTR